MQVSPGYSENHLVCDSSVQDKGHQLLRSCSSQQITQECEADLLETKAT